MEVSTTVMDIQTAPWLEKLLNSMVEERVNTILAEQMAAIQTVEPSDAVQHIRPEEICVDPATGKQYALRKKKNGATVRIPLGHTGKTTEPIRNAEDIDRLVNYLLNRPLKCRKSNQNIRDAAYVILSINVWRRAGDTLSLRMCDVVNPDGTIKQSLRIREEKTGKISETYMNDKVRQALTVYISTLGGYQMNDYLFPTTTDENGNPQHISVDGMRKMLQRAAKAIGLDICMGTHTLRKTGAYHARKNMQSTDDELTISEILRHSNVRTTYAYLGEGQTARDRLMEQNQLGPDISEMLQHSDVRTTYAFLEEGQTARDRSDIPGSVGNKLSVNC